MLCNSAALYDLQEPYMAISNLLCMPCAHQWLQEMSMLQCTLVGVQAEANMHDEMFGHLLAAMRFGADEAACLAAIRVAFR